MQPIGFSTGALFSIKKPFLDRLKLFRQVGADAVELGFRIPIEQEFSQEFIDEVKKFTFVSIHAPTFYAYKNDEKTNQILQQLKHICQQLPITSITIHPDCIEDFELLKESQLPFALENMDRQKEKYQTPQEIQKLKEQYPFNFVLDIQHAYELDPTMKKARDILEIMGERLDHIHVSGENSTYFHVPLSEADNQQTLREFMQICNVPIINEGSITKDIEQTIQKEIQIMRNP